MLTTRKRECCLCEKEVCHGLQLPLSLRFLTFGREENDKSALFGLIRGDFCKIPTKKGRRDSDPDRLLGKETYNLLPSDG